jgi:hypothetical protein
LTLAQLKQHLPADLRPVADKEYAKPGVGCAVYEADGQRVLVSYGTRFADTPYRYPPSHWGNGMLAGYCAPNGQGNGAVGVSPVLQNRDVIPQIRRPPSSPAVTQFPTMGVQQVPAALAPLAEVVEEDERRRLLPGGDRAPAGQASPQPASTVSEDSVDWWRRHLNQGRR